jgi:hypothetical protein
MELVLKLDKTQHALLTALNRAGAAKTPLQETAIRILDEGIRSEAKRKRINSEAVLATSIVEADRKKKERDEIRTASQIAALLSGGR